MECHGFSPAENLALDFNIFLSCPLCLTELITESDGFAIFSQVNVLTCTLD